MESPPDQHTRLLPGWIARYRREDLGADLAAGGTVAAMMIPQSMAYAHLAGFPPQVGLYTAVVPLLVYALLGRSSVLAIGPVASIALLAGAAAARVDDPGTAGFLGAAALLTLMVGVAHIAAWATRLARLVPRISQVSLDAFLLAVAVVIIATQADSLLGLASGEHLSVTGTITHVAENLGNAHIAAALLGAATIIALWAMRSHHRFPTALVCLVTGTAVVALAGLADGQVPVVGSVPSGLPTPEMPPLDGLAVLALPALAIALVSVVEVSAVDRRIDPADNEKPSETAAVGAANLAAGIFRGIPVTGAPTRSAVARDAGAKTQLTGVVAAVGALVLLLVGTPLLVDLPLPVLAGLVIVSAATFFRLPMWLELIRTDLPRSAIAGVIVAVTLLVGLEAGVAAVVLGSIADALLDRRRR